MDEELEPFSWKQVSKKAPKTHQLEEKKPHYLLADIQNLIKRPATRQITARAQRTVDLLGLGIDDLVDCIAHLSLEDFLKSIQSNEEPNVWQDIYTPLYCGVPLHLKFHIRWSSSGDITLIVGNKNDLDD